MTSDDEFERRLRDVLHDRQLSVTPAPDALERVHAGVRRRHQHRIVASGVAVIAVVAVAVGGVALRSNSGGSKLVAGDHISAAPFAPGTPATQPKVSASPSQFSSAAIVAPTPSPVGPQLTVASFTAVGTSSYWVLGATPDCTGGCTHVERTTDGGKTFESVGVMADKTALPVLTTGTPTASSVTDIRFADATHGWLYGGALLSTSDAGDTWSPVTMPGLVVDLAAVNGTAWAVVEVSGTTTFAVYRSNYKAAAPSNSWQRVGLPLLPKGNVPSLAVQGSTAYLLADDGTDGDPDQLVSLPVTGAVTMQTGPCTTNLAAKLSVGASKSILWAVCASGQQADVHVSADNGASWANVPALTSSLTLGGITASMAVLGQHNGPLVLLAADGKTSAVKEPAASVAKFDFIGFTVPASGFAVVQLSDGTGQLWRTLDGGHTWTDVSIIE
jgi:photosystem II stability/assembly factor-like uncharacterized protein